MPEVENGPSPSNIVNSTVAQATTALAPVVDSLLIPEPVIILIGVPGS
jgi:hypothetical protein